MKFVVHELPADTVTVKKQVLSQVYVNSYGCWIFTGYRQNGYGRTKLAGRQIQAHRLAYLLFAGPIPEGLCLDHLCRNRACINPDHLEPVTLRENILRGIGAGSLNATKNCCPKGHPYSLENTKLEVSGGRRCRTCSRLFWRRKYQRQRRGQTYRPNSTLKRRYFIAGDDDYLCSQPTK